jgi:hypothetical protein
VPVRHDNRHSARAWPGEYEAAFRVNEIDEKVLTSLTQEDLKEIGDGPVATAGGGSMPSRCCAVSVAGTRLKLRIFSKKCLIFFGPPGLANHCAATTVPITTSTLIASLSHSSPVRPCQGSGPGSRPAATSTSRSR